MVAFNLAGESVSSNTLSVASPAGTLPFFWRPSDVGNPGQTGTAAYDAASSTFTVAGGGADIWDTADQFQYVYQAMTGDGTITARVVSQDNTDPWAKAGLMFRDSLASNAVSVAVLLTASNGVAFQRRSSTGGGTTSTVISGVPVPRWVRLVRTGTNTTCARQYGGRSQRCSTNHFRGRDGLSN